MARLKGRLIEQYKLYHEKRVLQYSGVTTKRHVEQIAKIIHQIPTESILDYGCGKGTQYTVDQVHEPWGVMPTLFDPGVPGLDELPEGEFDGVICTGVLEHIPERELRMALRNLAKYARKWCFIIVGVQESRKVLPNGMPVHVTLQEAGWWAKRIAVAFDDSPAAVWFAPDRPRPVVLCRIK
jgi:hypothetical protein